MKIQKIEGIVPFTEKQIEINVNGKNLILTGKNGCGKTQLLESIYQAIRRAPAYCKKKVSMEERYKAKEDATLRSVNSYQQQIKKLNQEISELEYEKHLQADVNLKQANIRKHDEKQKAVKQYTAQIETLKASDIEFKNEITTETKKICIHEEKVGDVSIKNTILSYSEDTSIPNLMLFFNAFRKSSFQDVKSITSVEIERKNIKQKASGISHSTLESNAGSQIEKFLANWEVQSALRERQKDFSVTEELNNWKFKFENQLKVLLDNDSTTLKFSDKTLNYVISQKGKLDFSFRDLSAGYSSILKVFTELLMNAEVSDQTPESITGFVVIDEVDAHLHPSLQRKVLPFFSQLFPKIQFIVSTHSPFVISSEEDTVVYDLSTTTLTDEDLRKFGNDIILESIFDVPNYSLYIEKILNNLDQPEFIKNHLTEIYDLLRKPELLDDESFVMLVTAYRNNKPAAEKR